MDVHPSVTAAKRDNQIREGEEFVVGVQEEDMLVLDCQALDVGIDAAEWQPDVVVAFIE